jgi:hypothetical protein
MIKKIIIFMLCLSFVNLLQAKKNTSANYESLPSIVKKEGMDQKTFARWQNIIKDAYNEEGIEEANWVKSIYDSYDVKTLTVISNYYNNFIYKKMAKGRKRLENILKTLKFLIGVHLKSSL